MSGEAPCFRAVCCHAILLFKQRHISFIALPAAPTCLPASIERVMTKIAQIDDHGSALAWSPVKDHADVVALGTKESSGLGFDDYGGELELYSFNITNPEDKPTPRVLGKVKTASRFSSIDWSVGKPAGGATGGNGLIAGGMTDGSICIFDPSTLLSGGNDAASSEASLISTISEHSGGAVSAMAFSPHNPMELATGGSDGEVIITDLSDPANPKVTRISAGAPQKQSAEITRLCWNSQVPHILASAAGNGTVVVWDLKQNKAWCELRCESSGASVSDMAWNPSEGLHLLTASSDDRNPVLKLWDLRSSTTVPLTTLQGHQQGILSMSWCPHDESMLLTSGKDNRTLLWDLHSMTCVAELPNDQDGGSASAAAQQQQSASNVYGTSLSSSQSKRYDIQWSPLLRGVVSTCSFDRKVQAHSALSATTKTGRAPKWLKSSSGVSFGFGGAMVSFGATHRGVTIGSTIEEPQLRAASDKFEQAIAGGDYSGYCDSMAQQAKAKGDKYGTQLWGFMKIVFQSNAREQLLQYLGFDPDDIKQAAMDFEDKDAAEGVAGLSLDSKTMSKEAEAAVKQSLLVGNFEAAVECCFRSGNMADALMLASVGGAELWAKTQAEFLARETKKRPFLSIVNAIVQGNLVDLVKSSNPAEWHETLAILSTYGKSEEFPSLCMALGERLEEAGDAANASLCYICGLQLEKAVKYWMVQLEAANKINGGTDLLALQHFVEKVSVLSVAVGPSTQLDEVTAGLFAQYADALANQGALATAAKYCRSNSQQCMELRDRLYRSKDSAYCLQAMGNVAPDFPYSMINLGVSPGPTILAKPQVQPVAQPQVQQQQPVAEQNGYQSQAAAAAQQQPTPPAPAPAPDQLPPGWMEVQDPSSGRMYYYNQNTQETTWDKPAPPAPAPAAPKPPPPAPAAPAQPQYQQQQQPVSAASSQPVSNGSAMSAPASGAAPKKTLASKYGDGFVTSASHPELAEQYGNVGTSSAYMGAARPGTAVVNKTEQAPNSGPIDLSQPPELSADQKPIADGLIAFVTYFKSLELGVAEKKQLAEIEHGLGIYIKKLSRGDIDADTSATVGRVLGALQNRDFVTAMKAQTELVNHHWREHKDWLKGLKFLITMASKKSG